MAPVKLNCDQKSQKYLCLLSGFSILNRKQKVAFIENSTLGTLKGIINLLMLFDSNVNLIQDGPLKTRLNKSKIRLKYLWNVRNNKKENKAHFTKNLSLLDLLAELLTHNPHIIIEKGLPTYFMTKKSYKNVVINK